MGLIINSQEVTKIELGGVEVTKIEDSNGNVLYSATPAQSKSVTLTYIDYDFSWSTSDGRNGSMTSGDPDYTLTISSGQTVTFTTAGGRERLSVNGEDQCPITLDGYTFVYRYDDLDDGDVVSCEYFREPCF